jgi:hypothetical protein
MTKIIIRVIWYNQSLFITFIKKGGLFMEKYHFKEAFTAGLLGGFLMLAIQMVVLPLFTPTDAWEFPSVMATLLINSTAPDIAVLIVGMILTIILSILFTLLVGWIPATWHPWAMIPVGMTYGSIIYLFYFLTFITIQPQLIKGMDLIHFLVYIAYGVFILYVYHTQVRAKYKPESEVYEGGKNI